MGGRGLERFPFLAHHLLLPVPGSAATRPTFLPCCPRPAAAAYITGQTYAIDGGMTMQ